MNEPSLAVELERRGAVAVIWLNRPDVLNAINPAIKDGVIACLAEAAADPEVGAAVLAGRGRAFCAGADRTMLAAMRADTTALEGSARHGARMIQAILDCRLPVVAAVRGYAVGGGVSLALAADIAIASEGTVFFIPEVELGVPYLWGSTPMLAASVGLHRARDLILGCDRFDAADAERWGILRAVVPEARLMDEAMARAERFASMPRGAATAQKRLNGRLLRGFMDWAGDEVALAVEAGGEN